MTLGSSPQTHYNVTQWIRSYTCAPRQSVNKKCLVRWLHCRVFTASVKLLRFICHWCPPSGPQSQLSKAWLAASRKGTTREPMQALTKPGHSYSQQGRRVFVFSLKSPPVLRPRLWFHKWATCRVKSRVCTLADGAERCDWLLEHYVGFYEHLLQISQMCNNKKQTQTQQQSPLDTWESSKSREWCRGVERVNEIWAKPKRDK